VARPVDLTKLLEYQQGAIVSRTVVERETGTVTVFAFDEGQCLSEHTAPFDALIYVLEGSAKVTVSDRESDVAPGEMFIMPADQPHAVRAETRLKMALVMIRS
jgi:quercetin dioxygenase-like cupin family protein